MRIDIGPWETLRDDARTIRYAVFVEEQGVPVELELDEHDPVCIHAVARDTAGAAVATGRLLPDGHIGRMAVLAHARGTGVGAAVLLALIECARTRGDASVVLNAQTQAIGFYERFGFVCEGDEFIDADIVHVAMRRQLR